MSVFDRGIRGNVQSPFNALGDASTIGYANPRLPQAFAGNVQLALDYYADALYPNYKGTVPNKAALPTTATVNDYYIVSDDGDGKSAGYVYSSLQGMTSWVKRYDVDYSAEGVLAEAMNRTSYIYVTKYGASDRDANGTEITGQFAGQTVYGGEKTGQNLTFFGNKTAGLDGFIQTATHFRPTTTAQINLGDATHQFQSGFLSNMLNVGLTSYQDGLVISSSGQMSFGSSNLITTGNITANQLQLSTLSLSNAGITDSSGTVSFGSNLIKTTGQGQFGTVQAGVNSKLADFTFTNGQIQTASTAINFANVDLSSIKNLTALLVSAPEFDAGDTRITSALIKTATGTTLTLQAAAGGNTTTVAVNSNINANQNLTVTGSAVFNGTVTLPSSITVGTSAKISTVGTDAKFEAQTGNLLLSSGNNIQFNQSLLPSLDNTQNLGSATLRAKTAFIGTGISDGTNAISIASLLSLRDINTNATSGMALFYNGTEWLPSLPDTEIQHNTLSGLTSGDAGHTQFALLAGRAGGQNLIGGSAAGENLTLDSTSAATKGLVLTSSTFAPSTDSALDVGLTAKQFRNVYTTGLFYGLRFDQYAGSGAYPANASAKIGRVIWDTSANQLLVDNGTTWSKVGNQKYLSDLTFDGTQTTQTVTVSGSISDARTGVWQLADNTNGFERIYAKMTFTQTQVTITTNTPLPAGTYRLVGFN